MDKKNRITLFKLFCIEKKLSMRDIRKDTGLSFNSIQSLWSNASNNRTRVSKLLSLTYKIKEDIMAAMVMTYASSQQQLSKKFKLPKVSKLNTQQQLELQEYKRLRKLRDTLVREFTKNEMSYNAISKKYKIPLRKCRNLILNVPALPEQDGSTKTKKTRDVKSKNITLFRAWCIKKGISLRQIREDCFVSESLVLKCFNSNTPKSNSTIKLLSMKYNFKEKEMQKMLTTYLDEKADRQTRKS